MYRPQSCPPLLRGSDAPQENENQIYEMTEVMPFHASPDYSDDSDVDAGAATNNDPDVDAAANSDPDPDVDFDESDSDTESGIDSETFSGVSPLLTPLAIGVAVALAFTPLMQLAVALA
jgi:hypothetical protein